MDRPEIAPPIDPEDVKLCNCAECGRVLLGASMTVPVKDARGLRIPKVAGRIMGRPFCQRCLAWMHGVGGRAKKADPKDDADNDPWYENAVRDLEREQ